MKPDPSSLPFAVEREITIRAPRATVFRYFTDSARFASWWGAGSTIEGRVGGKVHVVHPGGALSTGEVLEIEAGSRIRFTYGYAAANAKIPEGGSIVTVTLADDPAGTRLHLRHDVHSVEARDLHVQGWRFQLSLFANVAAQEVFQGSKAVERWFEAWNEADEAKVRSLLESATEPGITFCDRFSALQGLDDLLPHLRAARQHMPGVHLEQDGTAHHCQGTVLVAWKAVRDGQVLGTGRNVFRLGASGRIADATGLWGA